MIVGIVTWFTLNCIDASIWRIAVKPMLEMKVICLLGDDDFSALKIDAWASDHKNVAYPVV